jgi:Zn-finger protein
MSDMKCPFCQQELLLSSYRDDDTAHQMWSCLSCQLSAQRKIWQELIRTRKALDAAKKWLMKIGYLNMSDHGLGSEKMMTDWCKTVALHGLKEIETALEQKD